MKIIAIPGLDSSLDEWKRSTNSALSLYDIVTSCSEHVIDASLTRNQHTETTIQKWVNIIDKTSESEATESYLIVTTSFGSILGLMLAQRCKNIVGMLQIDPSTEEDLFRITDPPDSLLHTVHQHSSIENIPIPIFTILSIKLCRHIKSPHNELFLRTTNKKWKRIRRQSSHPASTIVVIPNGSHNLYENNTETIRYQLQFLKYTVGMC